jgi:hypothetical protein
MCDDARVDDAVDRYQRACRANNIAQMVETLAPDVELVSPLSGRMVFCGKDDVGVLLEAVYSSVTDFRWSAALGDGKVRVGIGEGRVGRLVLGDVMVTELADDGRIQRLTPHLRPWLALTALTVKLGFKLAGHPGVIVRALRQK